MPRIEGGRRRWVVGVRAREVERLGEFEDKPQLISRLTSVNKRRHLERRAGLNSLELRKDSAIIKYFD